jgi:hypothetical protein
MKISSKVLKRSKTLESQVIDVFNNCNLRVNISKLVAALNERLLRHSVRFRQQKGDFTKLNIVVTGHHEFSSIRGGSELVITLNYPNTTVYLCDECNTRLPYDIVGVLVHELTHREQHKARSGDASFKNWLDNTSDSTICDEIEAYANEAAYILYSAGYTISRWCSRKLSPTTRFEVGDMDLSVKQRRRYTKKLYSNLIYLESRKTK